MEHKIGDVSPHKYDWRASFGVLDAVDHGPFASLDVGKVRGLAIAHHELLATVAELLEVAGDAWRQRFAPPERRHGTLDRADARGVE